MNYQGWSVDLYLALQTTNSSSSFSETSQETGFCNPL